MATYKITHNPVVQAILDEYEVWAKLIGCSTILELNNAIEHGKEQDIILISEALQERKIISIADKIFKDKKKVILVAGPSSSGKSSFTQRLRIQLAVDGISVETLSMDNYFKDRNDTPRKSDGSYDFDSPKAIDIDLLNSHLKKMVLGEKVNIPYFNFETGIKTFRGETLQLNKNTVLIVEGIHALNTEMTKALDDNEKVSIYVTPLNPLDLPNGDNINPSDVRMIRRIVRDYMYRGFNAAATIAMWPMIRDNEIKYIYPTAENADIIVNTSLIYELSVLKPYLIPLLKNCRNMNNDIKQVSVHLLDVMETIRGISFNNIPSTSIMREFVGGSTFSSKL